jgi:hypothetical protein
LSGGGTLAERYLHGALRARSLDGEGDLLARLPRVDLGAELVSALDRVAVDGRDLVAALQTRAVGRRAVHDLLQPRLSVVGEADAEVGVVDAAVADQLACNALRGVAGDGVADPDVAAGLAADLRGDAYDACRGPGRPSSPG